MTNSSFVQPLGRYFGQQLLATLQARSKTPLTKEESNSLQGLASDVSRFYGLTFKFVSTLSALFSVDKVEYERSGQATRFIILTEDPNRFNELKEILCSIQDFFQDLSQLSCSDPWQSSTVLAEALEKVETLLKGWHDPNVNAKLTIIDQIKGFIQQIDTLQTTQKKVEVADILEAEQKLMTEVMNFWQRSLEQVLASYFHPPTRSP